MTTVLSGIKPSGTLHLGNYLGMIRPALALAARSDRSFYFIADVHALNTLRDVASLRALTLDIAASLLALGLDPERTLLYRQSDVPETFELEAILAAVTPKGAMNRAHAYKAAVSANEVAGRPADEGVNMGLFTYPILMAADILLMDADLVPVGRDQAQHVEIARDIAEAFNSTFGEVLQVPTAAIDHAVETVPGLDGRKMSKSYGNTIPMFAEPDEARQLVSRIKTDSRSREEPKDPDSSLILAMYRQFVTADEMAAMRERFLAGGLGYAEAKSLLADVIERELGAARSGYVDLRSDETQLQEVLADGAGRARKVAGTTLARVRAAVGLGPGVVASATR